MAEEDKAPARVAAAPEEPKKASTGHRHTWQGFRMAGQKTQMCVVCGKTKAAEDDS